MAVKYSFQNYKKEDMARAIGISLPISTKQSVELCNFIRHKPVKEAIELLERVIAHKTAVPFRRYNDNIGHKTKIGPGRFPEKASREVLNLIKTVESNAQFKGLPESGLGIIHLAAQKAARPLHPGRKRGRKMKRTSIEIVVSEIKK